ncbi:MAG: hypothetical protein ACRDZ3_01160 [Acidimicrobiia bacterium]
MSARPESAADRLINQSPPLPARNSRDTRRVLNRRSDGDSAVLVDPEQATASLRTWFPDLPGSVQGLRFGWSPGRLDPEYLGDRSAFDAAFLIDAGDGTRGVVGVDCRYLEQAKAETPPSGEHMTRYRQVTERSGIFTAAWEQAVVGTDLQPLWRNHLLALSMAQHFRDRWSWVRFVVVHPAGNSSFADAAGRYRAVLTDGTTFEVHTLEALRSVTGRTEALWL